MLDIKLVEAVLDWADDKDALNKFIFDKQLMKVGEEVNELCTELVLGHHGLGDKEKALSEIGDVVVTLIVSDYLKTEDRAETIRHFENIKLYPVKPAKYYTDFVLNLYEKYTDMLNMWNVSKLFSLGGAEKLINTCNRIANAEGLDKDINYALELAVNKNSKRTGTIVNGSFVKDSY